MPRKPAVESKSKKAKSTKTKTTTKKKTKPAYPSWKEMITKAIVDEKKRNGSSRQAIAKYILSNYPVDDSVLKIQLKLGLRRMLAPSGDDNPCLEQHKGSYKLSPDYKDTVKKANAKKAKDEKAKEKKEKKDTKKSSKVKESPAKSPRKSPSKSPRKSPVKKGKSSDE